MQKLLETFISLVTLFGLLLIQLPRSFRYIYVIPTRLFLLISFRFRNKVIKKNLALCFPHLNLKQQQKIRRQFLTTTAFCLVELMYFYFSFFFSKTKYVIKGEDYLQQAIDSKKAIILVTAHFAGTFISAGLISKYMQKKIANVYRPQSNKVVNFIYTRKQHRLFIPISKFNPRGIIRALRKKIPVIYLFDLNDSSGEHFIPFFGTNAATTFSLCKMTQISDAIVIPYSCIRRNGGKYQLTIHEPHQACIKGEEQKYMTEISQVFENVIREHPDQYLWTHRRFKTRPENEEPPINY